MSKQKKTRKERQYFEDLEQHIRKTIGKIRAYNLKYDDKEMRASIETICQKAHTLSANLKKRPQHLYTIGTTLKRYIDAVCLVAEKYRTLESHAGDDHADKMMEKTKITIKNIEKGFQSLEHKLTADDLLELDIQLEIVDSDLEIDGLK